MFIKFQLLHKLYNLQDHTRDLHVLGHLLRRLQTTTNHFENLAVVLLYFCLPFPGNHWFPSFLYGLKINYQALITSLSCVLHHNDYQVCIFFFQFSHKTCLPILLSYFQSFEDGSVFSKLHYCLLCLLKEIHVMGQ